MNYVKKPIERENILLPGGNKQSEHLLEKVLITGENLIIIGSGCEGIANYFSEKFSSVDVIVNEYNSLLDYRQMLNKEANIKVKMMDFTRTDFQDKYFDLIYAQASISVAYRKDILKEIKRILRNDGTMCMGEIVSLKGPVPAFVKDIWERSGLEPLPSSEIKKFYKDRGFSIIDEKNLSSTLKDFYQKLRTKISSVSKTEIESNKKLYSAIKHEADAYLKLGGDKFIGYKSLIMRKII